MILQHAPEGTIAIRQDDHAAFAAFLLEHWSNNNFTKDPQRDQIILATRHHDVGWIAFDAMPRLDPVTCLPADMTSIEPEDALTIWRRATALHLEDDPFVALLITHHAYSIHEIAHKRQPAWKAFFTEFAQLRAELRDALGLDHPAIERAYSYLRMADWFSLQFCMRRDLGAERPEHYAGYQFRRVADTLQFKPYPFDQRSLSYSLPFFRMAEGGYRDEKHLRAAFDTPEMLNITIEPMGRL
ncbi:MAG TPA: DUF3891 family protein [Candidatus Kapabacteria bacterium]|nr:DUF3891 family protein [Candidatus Kapabacteria bacterium]